MSGGNNGFLAEVFNLADIIKVQPNSIVSSALIDKGQGTVTVFAFDKGQSLSEHTAPFDAFIYVIQGKIRIVISGKPYDLKDSQAIIMPAGEPHSLESVDASKMLLVMIKSDS